MGLFLDKLFKSFCHTIKGLDSVISKDISPTLKSHDSKWYS